MRRYHLLLIAAILVVALTFSIWTLAVAQDPPDSQPGNRASGSAQSAETQGSDSNPVGTPEVIIPEQYQVNAANTPAAPDAPDATSTVYFTPMDEDTSTTVLFLYNTNAVTETVGLRTFNLSGGLNINTSVSIPPGDLVRICGDTVSTISATWQNVVFVNFTTSSTYAAMTVPDGVKAEAYVVWNNASTYDPLQIAPTLPIRFSTDPVTLFLPLTQRP